MRTLLATLLLVSPCVFAGGQDAAAATAYGAPMPAGAATPVSAAIAAFDAHSGQPGRFSGRIAEVCQAEGCWMMLEDDGVAARVMFRDHAFLVPKDASGRAVVHGVLSRKTLSPDAVEHLAADSAPGVAVSPVEYRIVADGVEIGG